MIFILQPATFRKKASIVLLFIVGNIVISKAQYTISTIAGNGTNGYNGDGIQATSAELNSPVGILADASGNVFIADYANCLIREVNTAGIISTIAGNGTNGYSGDGGQATAAELSFPAGIVFDGAGNFYIAETSNNRIRKVNTSGIISTIAGNGFYGYNGDGIQATTAWLAFPNGVTADASNNIYIDDLANSLIRKVNTSGIISSIVGNGTAGYTGDGGAATAAELNRPQQLTLDASGNFYIADWNNNRIRMVNTSGIISTIAGNGTAGFSGDGGAATTAELSGPTGITLDGVGNMYITDWSNNRIRMVNTSGIISTIAGNGIAGFSGDGGSATAAELNKPVHVSVDGAGNIYIADQGNSRIRKLTFSALPITLLSFNAVYDQTSNTVGINWSTASEVNNKFFTVQKSINGEAWDTEFSCQGAGNSGKTLYYSTKDENPYNGISYYRLKQTDYDGHYTYSNIISVSTNTLANNINVFPNPATNKASISFTAPIEENATLTVYNYLGEVVKSYQIPTQAGSNIYQIDLTKYTNGIYFIIINTEAKEYTSRLAIEH